MYDSVYSRRRTLTADIHVRQSIHAERGTRQAIIIPKTASCATTSIVCTDRTTRAKTYLQRMESIVSRLFLYVISRYAFKTILHRFQSVGFGFNDSRMTLGVLGKVSI